MYSAGIEGILGHRREGEAVVIDPCIPAAWPEFEASVRCGSTRYEIKVANPMGCCRGVEHAELDGAPVAVSLLAQRATFAASQSALVAVA